MERFLGSEMQIERLFREGNSDMMVPIISHHFIAETIEYRGQPSNHSRPRQGSRRLRRHGGPCAEPPPAGERRYGPARRSGCRSDRLSRDRPPETPSHRNADPALRLPPPKERRCLLFRLWPGIGAADREL